MSESTTSSRRRLPPWMRKTAGDHAKIQELKKAFRGKKLHTVCEEARCPNLGECWSHGVATFMILGETCTRACRFCSVDSGKAGPVDPFEPMHVANEIAHMPVKHVVVTSVARDDLADEGAGHFAQTIRAIRTQSPQVTVEVLVPDFHGRHDCLKTIGDAGPQIFNHNIETIRRLTPSIRSKARYDRTLTLLQDFKAMYPNIHTKSGFMVGLGETMDEVKEMMNDLRNYGVSIITIGQYLQPTKTHAEVVEFIHPDQFKELEDYGKAIGFLHTFSGPFVRSSYMAERQFLEASETQEAING